MQAQLQQYKLELASNVGPIRRMPNLAERLLPQPSLQDLASILHNCSTEKEALYVHALMCDCGVEADTLLGTYIVATLAAVGTMGYAQQVFDRLNYRTEQSWSSLISGYFTHEKPHEALSVYRKMQKDGSVHPNYRTFVVLLQACAKVKDLERGLELHLEVNKAGLCDGNLLVGSVLVYMYAKCGSLAKAQQVIESLPVKDVVSWTALITGYSEHGCGDDAFKCFEQMKCEGIFPNAFTFVSTLKGCGCEGAVNKVCEIHTEIEMQGLVEIDLVIGNTLVDVYGKCGILASAETVFDKLPVRDIVSWTALIANFVQHEQNQEALDFFERMRFEGIPPNPVTYVCCLKACANLGATSTGRELHMEIETKGLVERNLFIGSTLVDLYAKCGLLLEATDVFGNLPARDVVLWTSLIGGYMQQGHGEETLECFEYMQRAGISPNAVTFAFVLKACGSIGAPDRGQDIHAEIERQGLLKENLVVGNTLIDMYVQCSLLAKGREVFDCLPARNIVSWNTLIVGYNDHGHGEEAVELFERMELNGISPNAITFGCIVNACGSIGAINIGQLAHAEIEKRGLLEEEIQVRGALVDMYVKCGSLEVAKQVFHKFSVRDVASWTALIAGYVEHGCSEDALKCFEQMQLECVLPNTVTILYGLKACGNIGATAKGCEIHVEIERQGLLEGDDGVANSLVDMYVKCGLLAFAQQVFDNLPVQDTPSLAALLSGYLEHSCSKEAHKCFEQMQLEDVSPDAFSYVCRLKACSGIGVSNEGLHIEIERKGLLERSNLVGNALISMYMKSGLLEKAQQVFDTLQAQDIVSWNTLISGYADYGHGEEALICLEKLQLLGVSPDAITYVFSLKACGDMRATCKGGKIHSEIERRGLVGRDWLIGSALIKMYTKFGSLAKAQHVFDKFATRNIVLWNVLMAGHAQHGHAKEALKCFEQMQLEGVFPNTATFLCCLKACSSSGATDMGRKFHTEIERKDLLEKDILLGSTLVDMYAKCGFLGMAQEVFDGLLVHDVVSWTALIAGYSRLGENECVFAVFNNMLREGMEPDPVIFIVILSACKHTGVVTKSLTYFESMSKDYGIDPMLDHTTCVIDMLGRTGQIDKAVELIKKMPFGPNVKSWDAVLGACRYWGNVKFGKIAFRNALYLDRNDAMAYVLMSHLYAAADLKGDVDKFESIRETTKSIEDV